VHCLLVPIRSEDGTALPGVTLSDCGPKLGLNGVDNGRIVFDRVRVPRDACWTGTPRSMLTATT
jgi:acyl-CoA oxidase